MTGLDRRQLLGAMTAGVGAALLSGTTAGATAAPDPEPPQVTPCDARYAELVTGVNQRWSAHPDAVVYPATTAQVLHTVQRAVAAGHRITVRSGGHCYGDFVSNPQTRIILDLSGMNDIAFDPARRAFAVGAGAQLGEIYQALYHGWGVTLPGGVCLTVGAGGHACGGGLGLLSRKFGLVADHIAAVEMVVVDRTGKAQVVVAGRRAGDPNRDLAWAVAGGGGGSFGVVTRFWFATPSVRSAEPADLLPAPPPTVLLSVVPIPWARLTEATFTTLVRNFASWYENNSAPGAPATALSGVLFAPHVSAGGLRLLTVVDATAPGAAGLLAGYGAAVTEGTGVTTPFTGRPVPWLQSAKLIGTGDPTPLSDPTLRSAVKSAFLRQGLSDYQLSVIHTNLTRTDFANPNATLQLSGGGGAVNAVSPTSSAFPHRDSCLFLLFESFWTDAADDAANVAFLRDVYGQTFGATGGYPLAGAQASGCYVNDPDPDIVDPAVNLSGAPYSTLYWGQNYPRLQAVKARWDPTNVFSHSQSVTLP